jgi:hypothetical protein
MGCGTAFANEDDVTGIWCAPKGQGPRDEWILTGDDEAIHTRGGRIDTTYEIAGDRFKARTGVEPEGAGPTDMAFRVDDDTLTLGRSTRYSRLRGPYENAHPIVGEWSITHQNGQRTHLRLSRRGALQLFFPRGEPTASGYRRDGNRITVDDSAMTFTFDPRKRVLVGPGGEEFWRFEF